jgi:hypothetical protein
MGAIVQVHLKVSHRLDIEAKLDSLYTTPTFFNPHGVFHKGYMPSITIEN